MPTHTGMDARPTYRWALELHRDVTAWIEAGLTGALSGCETFPCLLLNLNPSLIRT